MPQVKAIQRKICLIRRAVFSVGVTASREAYVIMAESAVSIGRRVCFRKQLEDGSLYIYWSASFASNFGNNVNGVQNISMQITADIPMIFHVLRLTQIHLYKEHNVSFEAGSVQHFLMGLSTDRTRHIIRDRAERM